MKLHKGRRFRMPQMDENDTDALVSLKMIQKIIDYLEENLLENFTLKEVADHFFINSTLLNQLFKLVNHVTVMEYMRNRRLSLAGQELLTTKASVIDLALKYGYETPEAFTKAFARLYGFPPSFVRRTYPSLQQFKPIKIQLEIYGGWEASPNQFKPSVQTKQIASEQENSSTVSYNDLMKSKGGFIMKQESCNYHIDLKSMKQQEDWGILMRLVKELKDAGISFKVDGKTMIFAHGLEFPLEKICLTFKWNDEQKVREFFGEEGSSQESYPGFKYFDTMFGGMMVRCMCYGEFPGSDTEEVLYHNTDLVEVDGETVRVQSLEFYYENAKPDPVYYKMVEDWLKSGRK